MEEFVKFNSARTKRYEKAGYRIVGEHKHAGVEVCRWTKTRMRGERNCYKAVYGIKSHRCVQMTPTLDFCSFSCQFCWRDFGPDRFKSEGKWDSPRRIVNDIIAAQRTLLSGFGGHSKTSRETFEQAMDPEHVAISLDGEPTLYPYLPEMINEIKSRGMTAFLVTNGTMPNKLRELVQKDAEPTNLYISVYATNEGDYKEITRSFLPDAWARVLESLTLMKEFVNSRTIFRMTLVKGLNMKDAERYAELIKMADPKFVEFKGYSWIGKSQERLTIDAMPSMQELDEFAAELLGHIGYKVKYRDVVSRVIVMVKDDETWNWSIDQVKEHEKMFKEKEKERKAGGLPPNPGQ